MQYPSRVGPIANDQAPFEPAMVQGCLPDRPRLPMPRSVGLLHAGWSTSQLTHDPAPFQPNMTAGYQPVADVVPGVHAGWIATPPDVILFSIEMVAGWHPDQSRVRLGPKIPLPWAETTPVAAPFGPEMAAGWHADRPRLPFVGPVGWTVSQPTHTSAPFSLEMTQGVAPDRPKRLVGRSGWSVTLTDTIAVVGGGARHLLALLGIGPS